MELTEHINTPLIKKLLKQNHDLLDKKVRGQLGIIMKRSNDGELKVTYDYSKHCRKTKVGRLYPTSISLSILPKRLRNFLLKEKYGSLDIVNCHYSLAVTLAKKWETPHEAIEEYVKNRETIIAKTMEETNKERKEVKKMYLKLAFSNKVKPHNEFAKKIQNEMNMLAVMAYSKYPEWHNLKFRDDVHTMAQHDNRAHSLLAYVLQTEELKVMQAVMEALDKCDVDIGMYNFDGLFVNKDQYNKMHEQTVIWTEYIQEQTGHVVELMYEPVESTFELEEDTETLPIEIFAEDHFMILGRLFVEFPHEPERKAEVVSCPDAYCERLGPKYWKLVQRTMPQNRCYKYFDFIPYNGFSNNYNPNAYNQFKGFKFEEYFPEYDGMQQTDWFGYCHRISESVTQDDYTVWKNSMIYKQLSQYLCASNPVSYKYVTQYLARIIFQPNYRIGKMMIFRNNTGGTGKTAFFYKLFIEQIIGEQYGSTHSGLSEVFGEKNMNIQNKLLLILEESEIAQTKDLQGKIKEAVDRDKNHVRLLYHNPYPVKNTVNYILNTNKEIGIVFERDNMRRFPVFDVIEHRLTVEEIQQLTKETYNVRFVKIFLKVLLNEYDPKFNFNEFPKSETCEMLQQVSMHPVEQFIRFLFVEWNDYIQTTWEFTFGNKYLWHRETKPTPFKHSIDEIYDIYKLFSQKRLPNHKVLEFKSFTNNSYWTAFKAANNVIVNRGIYEIDYKQVRKSLMPEDNLRTFFDTDKIVSSAKRARINE